MSIAATGPVPAWWSTPTASGRRTLRDDVIGRHTDADAAPSEAGWGEDGFGFSDFLDIINPLQHIPGVSTVYREMTGDTIADAPRAVGGMIWGGPLGLVAAVANSITQAETGRDLGGNVVALAVGGAGDPSATDPGASMDLPSPPGSGPRTRSPGTTCRLDGSTRHARSVRRVQPGDLRSLARRLDARLRSPRRVDGGGPGGVRRCRRSARWDAVLQWICGWRARPAGGEKFGSGTPDGGGLARRRSPGGRSYQRVGSAGGGTRGTCSLGPGPAAPGSVMSAPRQILPSALSTAPSSPSSAQVRLGVPALARSGENGDGLDPRTRAAAENLANPGAGPRPPTARRFRIR